MLWHFVAQTKLGNDKVCFHWNLGSTRAHAHWMNHCHRHFQAASGGMWQVACNWWFSANQQQAAGRGKSRQASHLASSQVGSHMWRLWLPGLPQLLSWQLDFFVIWLGYNTPSPLLLLHTFFSVPLGVSISNCFKFNEIVFWFAWQPLNCLRFTDLPASFPSTYSAWTFI